MIEVKWKYRKRLSNLIKQLNRIDNQFAEYGYFKEQRKHPESPHLSFASLMAIHELRPNTDPEYRPVFKKSLEKHGDEFINNNLSAVKTYIDRSAMNSKPSPMKLLEEIAINGIEITKPTFGDPSLIKGNTISTIKRKGRNTPMVEFGILKEALSFKTSLRKSVKSFN